MTSKADAPTATAGVRHAADPAPWYFQIHQPEIEPGETPSELPPGGPGPSPPEMPPRQPDENPALPPEEMPDRQPPEEPRRDPPLEFPPDGPGYPVRAA